MLINRYLIVFMLLFIFASCEDKESSSKKEPELTAKERAEQRKQDSIQHYRDSLFKQMPDRYVILDISLRLDRNKPLNLGYRELADYFAGVDSQTLSAEDVAEAVMCIRQTKLPDPDRIPNAGSFFKNPVVPATVADQLLERFPGLVTYTQADGQVKLAAGWLIDQRGWKGFSNGVVGVHHRQALVLTNHGGSGRDVLALAARIADDIAEHYGVELEIEPRIAG